MKQSEFRMCAICGNGMAAAASFFYRVTVEQLEFDLGAALQHNGLDNFLGNPNVEPRMITIDEELAKGCGSHVVLICGNCGITRPIVAHSILEAD